MAWSLVEVIKNKIFKKTGNLEKLKGTPNDNRLTFITDDEAIRIEQAREAKVWYYGNASELLNYYTNQQVYGWAVNPIYNRNSLNLFWGQSVSETNIKRVHVDVAKAIVDTLSSVIGEPNIDYKVDSRLERIVDGNNFKYRFTQEYRTIASVEGDGCLKWNFYKDLAPFPLVEYYGTEDWTPIVRSGILVGLIFRTYYKDRKDNNYVLIETRSLQPEGCLIEFELYKIDKRNNLFPAEFKTFPELAYLEQQPRMLINVKKLFACPLMYFNNPVYKNRGKSIYDGKISLLDTLDEIWSQAAQTNRVSTPVEYYDVSLLERDKQGRPILPSKYNRQYIAKSGPVDGDGNTREQGITTTQPDLNFDKYSMLARDVLSFILVGYVSPSTLGFDVAKKDNADAQREKEKQTIFTRGTYITQETKVLKEFLNMGLMLQDYMDTGVIKGEYEISITYDEFANPSFESELAVLGPAWSQGQISTEQYVKMLWAGKLNEEEIEDEKAYLDENKEKDNFDMGELLEHENGIKQGLPGEGSGKEAEEGSEE